LIKGFPEMRSAFGFRVMDPSGSREKSLDLLYHAQYHTISFDTSYAWINIHAHVRTYNMIESHCYTTEIEREGDSGMEGWRYSEMER